MDDGWIDNSSLFQKINLSNGPVCVCRTCCIGVAIFIFTFLILFTVGSVFMKQISMNMKIIIIQLKQVKPLVIKLSLL